MKESMDLKPTESKNEKEEGYKSKFRRALLQMAGGIVFMSVVTGIEEGVQIEKMIETHKDKVTETEVEDNIDGKTSKHKEFRHEDTETTHIINALCGKEPFTEKEKLDIAIGITVQSCNFCKVKVPEDIKNWTLQEVRNLYIQTANSKYYPDELDRIILYGPEYSQELYSIIWEQEKKSGSPYVRWNTTENTSNIGDGHNRAYYVPETHTICINPESLTSANITEEYVAEVAHAIQFNGKPIRSALQSRFDNFTINTVSMQTGVSPEDVHDYIMYEQPGTIEFEAHHEIEPPIQAEVKKIIAQKITEHPSVTYSEGEYYPESETNANN